MTPLDQDDATLLAAAGERARVLVAALERDGATLAVDPAWQEGAAQYARAAEAARRLSAEIDRVQRHEPAVPLAPQAEIPPL